MFHCIYMYHIFFIHLPTRLPSLTRVTSCSMTIRPCSCSALLSWIVLPMIVRGSGVSDAQSHFSGFEFLLFSLNTVQTLLWLACCLSGETGILVLGCHQNTTSKHHQPSLRSLKRTWACFLLCSRDGSSVPQRHPVLLSTLGRTIAYWALVYVEPEFMECWLCQKGALCCSFLCA